MKLNRRMLIKGIGTAGLVGTLPLRLMANRKPLKVLILGGTGFIGPHIVRAVVAAGHDVTLFNRGKSNPDLFNELEKIKGDRHTKDIQQLANRKWDVVIDPSAYFPRAVNMAMDVLANNMDYYIFISTESVYASFADKNQDETAPVLTIDDPTSEEINKHYGALKVLCEQAAENRFPGRVINMRLSAVGGPGDHTDRFTYWPNRIARGGDVLAPGDGSNDFQVLDVRDLADWIVHCLDHRVTGTYNTTSPRGKFNMRDLVEGCRNALNKQANITWVAEDFLLKQEEYRLGALPFWLGSTGPYAGANSFNTERAHANGLKTRPLEQTIVDTYNWFKKLPEDRHQKILTNFLTPDNEKEILKKWHQFQAQG